MRTCTHAYTQLYFLNYLRNDGKDRYGILCGWLESTCQVSPEDIASKSFASMPDSSTPTVAGQMLHLIHAYKNHICPCNVSLNLHIENSFLFKQYSNYIRAQQ